MRIYSFKGSATTSTSGSKTIFNIKNPSTPSARIKIRSISIYSNATPASEETEFFLQRTSADGTAGSNPTPSPHVPTDTAATSVVGINYSSEPTYLSGNEEYNLGLYQPSTFSKTWAAGEEPEADITAAHGLGFYAAQASAAYEVDVEVEYIED